MLLRPWKFIGMLRWISTGSKEVGLALWGWIPPEYTDYQDVFSEENADELPSETGDHMR
jgi:hypothetical protein